MQIFPFFFLSNLLKKIELICTIRFGKSNGPCSQWTKCLHMSLAFCRTTRTHALEQKNYNVGDVSWRHMVSSARLGYLCPIEQSSSASFRYSPIDWAWSEEDFVGFGGFNHPITQRDWERWTCSYRNLQSTLEDILIIFLRKCYWNYEKKNYFSLFIREFSFLNIKNLELTITFSDTKQHPFSKWTITSLKIVITKSITQKLFSC